MLLSILRGGSDRWGCASDLAGAMLGVKITVFTLIHCVMLFVVMLPRIPCHPLADSLPSICQNCGLHFRIIFTKKKKRNSKYLPLNYIYLRVKGHFVSSYLNSGELLITEYMKTLKLSVPFPLQNIFTREKS